MRLTTNFAKGLLPRPVIIRKTRLPVGGFTTELLPPPPPSAQDYNLWEFVSPYGASLNEFNVLFDPSIAVEANWGDGSIEAINSNTTYNHTFN